MIKVLIIAEDKSIVQTLQRHLNRNECVVSVSANVDDCLRNIRFTPPSVIICDTVLPPTAPQLLLTGLEQGQYKIPVIFLIKSGELRLAIKLMQAGAFDCKSRAPQPDELLAAIQQAVRFNAMDAQQTSAVGIHPKPFQKENAYYFNQSSKSQQLLEHIKVVAPTNYSVIIYGESGAGKEGVAREIHKCSKRSNKPFIAIDCGALSKELAASELFGHEKGSFTGAIAQKKGQFENAHGGTLLLDEVANLPYDIQVLLLRAIQEKKIRRVGGTSEIPIDVRLIVASNERLSDAVAKGKFRQDLYHRFNEFSIEVLPLRERKDDILFFAERFLDISANELNRSRLYFDEAVKHIFLQYPWYGNLREMRNIISRATLLCNSNCIIAEHLPIELRQYNGAITIGEPTCAIEEQQHPEPGESLQEVAVVMETLTEGLNLKRAAQEAEYALILAALRQADFKKAKTAELLGINRRTLYNKMKLIKQR